MFPFLKHFAGATPGKSQKRKTTDIASNKEDTKEKARKYDQARKRTYQVSWQLGREWLEHDDQKGLMKCKICCEH
jgi:hypothetical protein